MTDKPAKAESFLEHLGPLQGALEGYCRRALRDRNLVADVLQATVANAYRDFHLYVQGTNFRTWIFSYVHLEIQNQNRKYTRTRHAELPTDLAGRDAWDFRRDEPLHHVLLEDPDRVLDECDEAVSRAISELPDQERAVLLLAAIGEFKYREIATILQIPMGTVMSSLARARGRLRRHLVQYGEAHGLLKGDPPEES